MLLVKWTTWEHSPEYIRATWGRNPLEPPPKDMTIIKEHYGRVHFPTVKDGITWLMIQEFGSPKLVEKRYQDVDAIEDPHKYEKKIRHAMKALGKTDKEADSPLTDEG